MNIFFLGFLVTVGFLIAKWLAKTAFRLFDEQLAEDAQAMRQDVDNSPSIEDAETAVAGAVHTAPPGL